MADRKVKKVNFPNGIFEAAQNGELVLFIGAGVSALLGCPLWKEFSERVLDKLKSAGGINYADLDALKHLDIKKQISIAKSIAQQRGITLDFEELLEAKKEIDPTLKDLYAAIYKTKAVIITTNYDKYLDDVAQKAGVQTVAAEPPMSVEPQTGKRNVYFKKEDFTPEKLQNPGTVIHLHGSIEDSSSMVVTTSDYIEHYQNEYVRDFLKSLFETKVVLFIGYGLEEEEILEYALRKREVRGGKEKEDRHFWLYPLLAKDALPCKHLKQYFSENFGVKMVEYSIDEKGHIQLAEIIRDLSDQLDGKVERPVFSKEVAEALRGII